MLHPLATPLPSPPVARRALRQAGQGTRRVYDALQPPAELLRTQLALEHRQWQRQPVCGPQQGARLAVKQLSQNRFRNEAAVPIWLQFQAVDVAA